MRPRNSVLQKRQPIKATSKANAHGPFHKPLFFLSVGLYLFGALMIYSASTVMAKDQGVSSFHYLFLQLVWLVAAFVLAYFAYRFNLSFLAKSEVATTILAGAIVSLILVLFIGKNISGATRWIDLGPFDLQPSEIAKLAFIIYLAALLSNRGNVSKNKDVLKAHVYEVLAPFVLTLGTVCGLILLQPDLDTAVIIAITALAMYYVSGTDFLHTVGTITVLVTGAILGVAAALLAPYRLQRVLTWFNFITTGDIADKTGTGYQIWNTLVAISTGGWRGLGYGESRAKLYGLSIAAFTDSIFTVVAEEFGLIGTCLVIVSFIYFLYLGIGIAQKAPDKFSSLMAVGVTTWITVQAFLNIGANLTLVPFGGIPLPFISYGGSNTLMIAIGVGLLLNIHSKSGNPRSTSSVNRLNQLRG